MESHLREHLTTYFSSEIALQTVNNVDDSMRWLRSTFFYVRAALNPTHYGLSASESVDDELKGKKFVPFDSLRDLATVQKS